jgi:hypothetical protein
LALPVKIGREARDNVLFEDRMVSSIVVAYNDKSILRDELVGALPEKSFLIVGILMKLGCTLLVSSGGKSYVIILSVNYSHSCA